MAVAVPRQFEIVRAAASGDYTSKIKLATELHRRTNAAIARNRNSAFQRMHDENRVALRIPTITAYINVARNIGLVDDSLKVTGFLNEKTPLDGFANYLRECLGKFSERHGFSVSQIRDFLLKHFDRRPYPIETATPALLFSQLNPNVSEFTFNQCLLMFDELGSEKFRVRSIRLLLHKDIVWGGA
jgi:hypothetical protein